MRTSSNNAPLDLGGVHLVAQDISGPTTFRIAATHQELLASYTAIETALPGFGFDLLADVTNGGAWHIGVMAGVAEMLLPGHERASLAQYAFPSLSATPGAIEDDDIDEFVRIYARAGGFSGAAGLYRSALSEAGEIRALALAGLDLPVLAIGGGSGDFTPNTLRQVASDVTAVSIDVIGHYVAMEAPDRLAAEMTGFFARVDGRG